MKNNHFIIKTERLTLRPLTLNDLNTTHEYASDVENTNFMLYLPNETIEDTKAFLTNVANEWKKEISSFYEFAIVFNQKHIGAVSISLDETKQEGELGWIINKAYQGNGYAFEAAQAIIDFAINELQVEKIVAHCDYRNVASYMLMQKLGLILESDSGIRKYKDNNEDIKEYKYSLIIN